MNQQILDCVSFLQWGLPQLKLRWAGFRKVRNQVCKRIRRRIQALNLQNFAEYQRFLIKTPDEWAVLDSMCIVTISRFYRDREVFNFLQNTILKELANNALLQGRPLKCWSAGCASGEEPHSLALIWDFMLASKYPQLEFSILATDLSRNMVERAQNGMYPQGALRDLPPDWRQRAFRFQNGRYHIDKRYQRSITFLQQDIRKEVPDGDFDLILCRNLIWFYYTEELQVTLHQNLHQKLKAGGALVIGAHEQLPPDFATVYLPTENSCVFLKSRR